MSDLDCTQCVSPNLKGLHTCEIGGPVIRSTQRMTDALSTLERLRDMGATDVVLNPDGSIARVRFGHDASSSDDEPQNEAPTPRRMSATGGLVPRDPNG
jgi:hypothetical protein